jgi:hypothetical protein
VWLYLSLAFLDFYESFGRVFVYCGEEEKKFLHPLGSFKIERNQAGVDEAFHQQTIVKT